MIKSDGGIICPMSRKTQETFSDIHMNIVYREMHVNRGVLWLEDVKINGEICMRPEIAVIRSEMRVLTTKILHDVLFRVIVLVVLKGEDMDPKQLISECIRSEEPARIFNGLDGPPGITN